MSKAGIYIHVPFCHRKCVYCDFYSVGERLLDAEAYVAAVEREYSVRRDELPESGEITLYIGGGTPSLLEPAYIKRLYEMTGRTVGEFTIEVNPDDVTEERAAAWRDAGVNRISMGVQTLDDALLKAIGRRHDAGTARKAYGMLRRHFDNISLDLMFGLPGQTPKRLRATVEEFIAMRPEHISAYSLMYEERTALTRLRDAGKIEELSDEDCVEMFRTVSGMLAHAGYERYEISNYSLPHRRSRHNSSYWAGVPYLGLGPSAHSYDGLRTRRFNPADLRSYLANPVGYEEERLSDDELREEMVMTRLRTAEGLDTEIFRNRFGERETCALLRRAARHISRGDLLQKGHVLILSETGVMVSDDIISDLF